VILTFCAFAAELEPIRARIAEQSSLLDHGLKGCYGRIGNTPLALVATGIGMRRSREATRRALNTVRNADLVIITGVAGALAPGLRAGQLVLADKVMTRQPESMRPEHILEAPRDWFGVFAAALDAAGIGFASGPLLTVQRPLSTAADKRLAAEQSGAIAVDMESAAIALEVSAHGLPFVCMRTILDTAEQDVAGAALADEEGHVRPLPALRALLTNPAMVVGVYRLVRALRLSTHSLAQSFEAVMRRVQ
jgi:adenosylhomocysteine nucleosidase